MGSLDNLRHEAFARAYIEHRGNGTKAYCQAYGLNYEDSKDKNTAKVRASITLTNVNVSARIREFLDDIGLNDEYVDLELKNLIWQDDDKNAKGKGIDIYNKLKRRYDNSLKIEVNKFDVDFD